MKLKYSLFIGYLSNRYYDQPFKSNIKGLPLCKTCTSELKLPHPHRYQEARWDDPNVAHLNIVHFLKPRSQPPHNRLEKSTW